MSLLCASSKVVAIVRDAALKALEERQALIAQRRAVLVAPTAAPTAAASGAPASAATCERASPGDAAAELAANEAAEGAVPFALPPVVVTPAHLRAAAIAAAAQQRITPAMLRFYETYNSKSAAPGET